MRRRRRRVRPAVRPAHPAPRRGCWRPRSDRSSAPAAGTRMRACSPLRSALSAVATSADRCPRRWLQRRPASAASARMPEPQPSRARAGPAAGHPRPTGPASAGTVRWSGGCEPNARPGSSRTTASSAPVRRRAVQIPRHDPGTAAEIHRLELVQPGAFPVFILDRAEAAAAPVQFWIEGFQCGQQQQRVAVGGNSALSTRVSHSGVSPTPGSRMACSLLVSASASSRVTASAPTSSSAFFHSGAGWLRCSAGSVPGTAWWWGNRRKGAMLDHRSVSVLPEMLCLDERSPFRQARRALLNFVLSCVPYLPPPPMAFAPTLKTWLLVLPAVAVLGVAGYRASGHAPASVASTDLAVGGATDGAAPLPVMPEALARRLAPFGVAVHCRPAALDIRADLEEATDLYAYAQRLRAQADEGNHEALDAQPCLRLLRAVCGRSGGYRLDNNVLAIGPDCRTGDGAGARTRRAALRRVRAGQAGHGPGAVRTAQGGCTGQPGAELRCSRGRTAAGQPEYRRDLVERVRTRATGGLHGHRSGMGVRASTARSAAGGGRAAE